MNLENLLMSSVQAPSQGHCKAVSTASFPFLWIRCKDDSGDRDAATVEVTGSNIVFTTDGTTADTTVNTTGTIDCSSPGAGSDTIGEVVDLINAGGKWEAKLLNGLRSWTLASVSALVTIAEKDADYTTNGVTLYIDASVSIGGAYFYCWSITGFDPYTAPAGKSFYSDENCQNEIDYISWLINASTAGNAKLHIYGVYDDGVPANYAEREIFTINIDNTQTTWGTHAGPIFKGATGERLMIIMEEDNSTTIDSDNMTVHGKCVDLTGAHINRCNVATNSAA